MNQMHKIRMRPDTPGREPEHASGAYASKLGARKKANGTVLRDGKSGTWGTEDQLLAARTPELLLQLLEPGFLPPSVRIKKAFKAKMRPPTDGSMPFYTMAFDIELDSTRHTAQVSDLRDRLRRAHNLGRYSCDPRADVIDTTMLRNGEPHWVQVTSFAQEGQGS